MTIKVYKVKRFQQNSDTVQADIQNAQFEQGSRADLRQDAFVEVILSTVIIFVFG